MLLKKISIISSIIAFQFAAVAQGAFTSQDFSPTQNRSAKKNQFVNDSVFTFNSDQDSVKISGVKERTNLIVTDHNQNDNAYFMPIGINNANHSVNRDRIRLILNNGSRHALIYKLDYETYAGVKAYQIITIRLVKGRKAKDNLCTMSVFDSGSAFSDFKGSAKEREEYLWQQAELATQNKEFKTRSCIPSEEHMESSEQPAIDLEEGDYMETSI